MSSWNFIEIRLVQSIQLGYFSRDYIFLYKFTVTDSLKYPSNLLFKESGEKFKQYGTIISSIREGNELKSLVLVSDVVSPILFGLIPVFIGMYNRSRRRVTYNYDYFPLFRFRVKAL